MVSRTASRSKTESGFFGAGSDSEVNPVFGLWAQENIVKDNEQVGSSNLKSRSKKTSKSIDVTTQVFDIAKKHKDKVSFISATPTPIEFLPEWITELNHIKMEWNKYKCKYSCT